MPFESEAQRKAMYAAAAGKSNIGIQKRLLRSLLNIPLMVKNSTING